MIERAAVAHDPSRGAEEIRGDKSRRIAANVDSVARESADDRGWDLGVRFDAGRIPT